MKTFIAAAAGVLCAVYAHAQAPYLVTDINTSFTPSAQSSNPKSFTASGPSVYFAATGATTGTELYKTDGATVQLVKDLRPGTASSTPTSLVDLGNGSFVFSAIDDANGRELWISDGSEAGTVPVKDIFPGTTSSAAAPLLAIGGKAFLLASTSAGLGLWITDGQEAGTQQLALVAPGPFRSAVIGSILYYSSGDSLWRSDGTPGGTYIVKSDLYARAIVATADKIFLAAWDQTHGYELWKSDGTEVGTTIVKDINPGAGGSFNSSSISMAVVNTTVVFFASDGEHDLSLWRSDGTESGTVLYHEFDLPPTTLAPPLVVAANVGFFALNSSLWRTDATDAGTFSLAAVANPYSFVATPTTLYFLGRDESIGFRLWKSDGTDLGTVEIAPDQSVAEADPQMRYANGKLYFSGTTGLTGNEPWTSDGTTAGTVMLANLMSDPPASANPIDLHASNGRLFFVANDGTPPWQLWRSDGTAPSTLQLTDFADTGYTTLDAPTAWNGQLFFRRAFNELWKSDGTVAGTTLLKEISVWTLFSTSNYLYFTAYASSPYYTYQLWRTDGTVAGTLKITDTNYYATPVGEIAGRFYFLSNGTLWRTEGTAATTVAVGNIGYYAQSPIVMGGAIYYSGAGDYPNYELWKTDGTPEGASLVKEIRPAGSASNPRNLTPAGSLLFFTADNGTTGEELWRSDGTEEGTFLLKDILPGAGSSTPTNMVAINGILYFVANNGVDGSELWKSDGTVAGTVLVADIAPGGLSSAPNQLAGADGKLWFTASTTANGAELWTSDGTPGGTSMVADIAPGAVSSSPRELTAAGRRLYFSAETSLGRELWAMPLAATAFSISDARILEQDSGTQPMRFTVTRSGDLSQAATVAFTTAGATATAGADFVAQSGTASFAIGAATAFIDVQVAGDNLIERNESFFVNLSAPSSGVLERNVGAGMIEDDDRTSAVNVVLLQDTSFNGYRRIVVTNAGPSSATSVELRYIESPRNPTFYSYSNNCVTVPGGGSVTCSLGTLLPGENRTISLSRNFDYYLYYDPENPPGATGTATVSAAEFDPNMADNTTARMFSDNGGLMTPAFFVTNTTASADYIRSSSSSPLAVTLSSTNPVVVPSPATVTIPAGQFGTTFSLLVGNTPGKTKLTTTTNSNPSNVMVIPIVGPGVTAKLDVVFWRPSSYYSYEYGDDVPFQVKVLARAADGSLPTGIVELLDEVGDVITQQALDATGSVTFLRTGLLPGNYVYGAHYVGDAKFNPLTFTFPAIFVSGWNTYTSVIVPRVVCGNLLDVMVTVSTTDTTQNPTGQVRIVAGGQETLLNLVPAEPGKSTATTQISLPQSYYYIDAYYQPTGTFEGSSNYNYLPSVGNCTPISLSATATATNRVSLTWNNTGAASYEIHRSDSNYGFQIVGYATTNSYLDTTAQPNQTYLYRIRPNIGQLSEPEIATTYFFGNDPLVPNVTNIKALHFTQLRTATNFARTTARLPQSASIATAPAAGVAILPAHIMELRAAVNEARRYLGLLPVTFTNPTITTGMQIKAGHLHELRNALK
jgi:ELWxxDGT repeat protein